jgi:hypothetical protein
MKSAIAKQADASPGRQVLTVCSRSPGAKGISFLKLVCSIQCHVARRQQRHSVVRLRWSFIWHHWGTFVKMNENVTSSTSQFKFSRDNGATRKAYQSQSWFQSPVQWSVQCMVRVAIYRHRAVIILLQLMYTDLLRLLVSDVHSTSIDLIN